MDSLSRELRGVVRKDVDQETWQQLMDFVLASLEPRFATAFQAALNSLRAHFTVGDVQELMSDPDNFGRVAMHLLERGPVFGKLSDAVQKAVEDSGKYWAKNASVDVTFNTAHPQVAATIKQQTFDLIQEIGPTTRDGIKAAVLAGQEAGVNPVETARQIKGMIGLTRRQAGAVANYRRLLTKGDPGALERELRDKRTDRVVARAIGEGKPLPPVYVEKLVDLYEQRFLKYRAETISIDQSLTALNNSQRLLWEQAVESGDVDPEEMYRRWFTADPCPICAQVPGMNPDGVGLDEPFQTPNGPVLSPPLHVRCKCVTFTRPRIRRAA